MAELVATMYSPGYAPAAKRLRASVRRFGYGYDEVLIEEPESWEGGCARKASALLQLLERHDKFVFIDADEFLRDEIPWLFEFGGEIALAVQPPPKEGVRWRSQKYRLHGDRYGERWLTGVMAVNRTPRVLELFRRWEKLCNENPDEWDEFLLFHAHRTMPNAPNVYGVPDDYRVIPLSGEPKRIGHVSASNTHWRLNDSRYKPERKVLLIGSAPYVPGWWTEHGKRYLAAGYSPICMNNAWRAIDLDAVHYWIRPFDFRGEEPPAQVPRNSDLDPRKTCEHRMWRCRPLWDRSFYTTLTHSLYHLANEAFFDNVRLVVHVVGSDFDYRGAQTHFYGKGTPDPLRHGSLKLAQALQLVAAVYQKSGHALYNAGNQEWTMLPFARASSERDKEIAYMFNPHIISLEESRKKLTYTFDRDVFKSSNGLPCEASDASRRSLIARKGRTISMSEAIKLGVVVIGEAKRARPKKETPEAPEEPKEPLVTAKEIRKKPVRAKK